MKTRSLAERTKEMQRSVILEVAARLFTEEGPNAVSMRRIAQASKTSTTVLYNLFGNKKGVIKALFMEGYTTFQKMVQGMEPAANPMQFLLEICERLWDFSRQHPHFYRITHGTVFPGFLPCDIKQELPQPRPQDLVEKAISMLQGEGLFSGAATNDVLVLLYSTAVGLINANINGLFPEAALDRARFRALIARSLQGSARYKPDKPHINNP